MNFNLKGKVIQVQDLVKGTSAGSGKEWQKQSFVIETDGQYPKKVCFTVWGDKTEILATLNLGSEAEVSFRVESREYNDKWYTDLTASDVKNLGGVVAPSAPAPVPDNVDDEDMPF